MGTKAKRLIAYGIAVTVLVAVFALYTQPQMMVDLSNLVWACFN